jgi:hypothetical protein
MAGPGRSDEEMAKARAARGPFSDPRDGRLLRQIRLAFWAFEGLGESRLRFKGTPDRVTTRYLMSWAYPLEYLRGELKTWHRTATIAAARKVARPVRCTAGKGARGRPFVWVPISEEVLNERSWQAKSRRRRKRLGLPPIDED